ncbi:uncharacterized protein ARMOST_15541 [Armillaria ostoyae]|uniref:Uncharacterized protein n=1 Tax=Armillaria ostoyae TaxID=47428 RepID=A0A284RTR4_ARMOS|nr:uncharacterized protein ARMOST_15541 [Armillaria ostoyae]
MASSLNSASMDAMKRHIFPRLLGVFGDDSASVPRRWFGSVRGLVFDRDVVGNVTRGRAEGERSIGDGLANIPAEDSGTCYASRKGRRRLGRDRGKNGLANACTEAVSSSRIVGNGQSSLTGIDGNVLWPYFTSGFMLMTIEEESETWRTAAMVDGVGRSGEDSKLAEFIIDDFTVSNSFIQDLAQCKDGEYDSVMTGTRVLIKGLQLDKYKILEDECHTELEFVEVQKY